MIKPEQISDEMLEIATERFEDAFWDMLKKQKIAEFLDDAIDAGLVVPASEVKVLRLAVKMLHVAYGALIALHYPGEKPPTVEFVIGEARKDLGIET